MLFGKIALVARRVAEHPRPTIRHPVATHWCLRDWRRLDERIEGLSNEIEAVARLNAGCERLIRVPGIGPIISNAMVAAIGARDVFSKGRDFAASLGLVPRQISTGDRTILGNVGERPLA
ncbi:transposase [Bradyrhizobium elkanii]|nr:transposase [Bradyrhizobium elkanii]MCS3969465.1 transposase [Bradyrhizobium japonicum]